MSTSLDFSILTTVDELETLFDKVAEASVKKEVPYVHATYRAMIEASPFAVLATAGPGGLDVSPRGDPPGFVHVRDERTLLLPERRGNNRIDSLKNILTDPRVALLFLIPGHGETLRVSGRACISVDPDLLQEFEMEGKSPKCVLIISVESVFFQCARAIHRSKLWKAASQSPAHPVPSAGTILSALTDLAMDGEKYDRELPARQQATLY